MKWYKSALREQVESDRKIERYFVETWQTTEDKEDRRR